MNKILTNLLIILCLLAGARAVSAETPAATLTVGSEFGCAYGSIQAAVDDANDGDTIIVQGKTFLGADSTVNIQDKSLTIIGGQFNCLGGTVSLTTMRANFQVDTIFELTGATAPRTVALHNFVLHNAAGDGTGGGIEISDNFKVELHNVAIYDNSADSGGGVRIIGSPIQVSRTALTLYGSQIYNHTEVDNGGGIYCVDAKVVLRDASVVRDNSADLNGGGLYSDNCDVQVFGSADLSDNTARNGGGIYATNGSSINLNSSDSDINENSATFDGGGIYLNDSSLLAQKGHVDGNNAARGAGVAAFDDALVTFNDITGCTTTRCLTLHGNSAGKSAGNYGGGVYANNSRVALNYASVDNNYAHSGSAVYIEADNTFGNASTLLSLQSVLLARNSVREQSVIDVNSSDNEQHTVDILGTTFAYNKTEFQQGDLLDLRLDGNLDLTVTGAVVRGDESEDGISLGGQVLSSVTCSVLPFGWNFSALKNVIGRQDVQFRDVATDDFRVEPTSPAVDICADATGVRGLRDHTRPVDLSSELGNQTISMGAYDAGAYEFGGLFGLNGAPCTYGTFAAAEAVSQLDDTIFGLPLVHSDRMDIVDNRLTVRPSGAAGCDAAAASDDRLTFDAALFDDRALNLQKGTLTMTQVTLMNGHSDDGGNAYLFDASLTMIDSTMQNGDANFDGGGIYMAQSSLHLIDSHLIDNVAFNDGGAVAAYDGSDIILEGTSAIGREVAVGISNRAENHGGAVLLGARSTLTLRDQSRIVDNEVVSGSGGAVFMSDEDNSGDPALTLEDDAQIVQNIAGSNGGGIYAVDGTIQLNDRARVTHNTAAESGGGISIKAAQLIASGNGAISQNQAGSNGGGVDAILGATVTIADAFELSHNSADGNGGGMSATSTTFSLADSTVISNTAGHGGGLYFLFSSALLTGTSTVSGNVVTATLDAQGEGGGIALIGESAVLTMTEQTAVANNVAYWGGGINVDQDARLVLLDSAEIHHNHAQRGAGIYTARGSFALLGNSTERPSLHHNVATSNGGGFEISNGAGENVMISHADIYDNEASGGAGGYISQRTVNFVNTVIENNLSHTTGGGLTIVTGASVGISAEFANAARTTGCNSATLPNGRYCSQLHNNSAQSGAALNVVGSTLMVTHTAITANAASNVVSGAGADSDLQFDTVLFYDNVASYALIRLTDPLTARITSSTLYNNGGIPLSTESADLLRVERSIIWGNTQGTQISAATTFASNCNIAQPALAGTQAFDSPSDSGADPLLVSNALGDAYLAANSPAIDACGDSLAHDINGVARPIDGDDTPSANEYDRGAFEFDPAAVPTAVGLTSMAARTPVSAVIVLFGLLLLTGATWRLRTAF